MLYTLCYRTNEVGKMRVLVTGATGFIGSNLLKTTVYKKGPGDKIYDKKCGQIKEENRIFGYRDY
jgi:hypothetical protein